MKLIVGLGNPGSEYFRTRHNAGFMVLDHLARRAGLSLNSKPRGRFHASTLEGPVAGERCLLLEPMTFMNRSGLAVAEAVNFFKLDLKDLLVLVDDVALPVGRIRLRPEGSDGGHNGLADIERALGTRNYPRLRIGIDAPGPVPQADYVLGAFSAAQWQQLQPVLDTACDTIECWITLGIDAAMTRYNAAE
jgi:PTH1 family peptidyl-tRNA hydrolase